MFSRYVTRCYRPRRHGQFTGTLQRPRTCNSCRLWPHRVADRLIVLLLAIHKTDPALAAIGPLRKGKSRWRANISRKQSRCSSWDTEAKNSDGFRAARERPIIIWLLPIGVLGRNPQSINFELRVHLLFEPVMTFGGSSRSTNSDALVKSSSKTFIAPEETTPMR